MDDKRKILYEQLSNDYDLDDFDSFSAKLDDENKRKAFYDAVSKDYDLGDYDSFVGKITPQQTMAEKVRNEQSAEPYTHIYDDNGKLVGGTAYQEPEPYQYKPEVQQHIVENIPSMFKSNNASLMDKPLGEDSNDPELISDKFSARIGTAQKYYSNEELQNQRRKKEETDRLTELSASIDTDLALIEEQINNRRNAVRNENWKPGMSSSRDDKELANLRGQRAYLDGAKELTEESQKIVNAANAEKEGNFFGGLGRGIRDTAFDIDNWTMGISDLVGGLRLKSVLEKAEKGEDLTTAEEKLLDASINNMVINAFYQSDLGRGYKAGQVSGESLPFMLEFLVNPVSASGNAMAKKLLTYGLKKFGKAATNNAVKAITRLGTDAVAAAGMTATTGLPGVLGESVERLNRNYEYGFDEEGNLNVNKVGNESFGSALGMSATTRFLENQSEMIFNAFKGASKMLQGVEQYIPGGVNTFMNKLKNSRVGEVWREIKNNPTMRELAERTQFHGIGEEYLEEVYNNIANVALGEMSLEDAISLDNNIDTFLGLAPTSVAFGAIGVGGMAIERYKNRKEMERVFGKMSEEQKKKLEELQQMGRLATNEDIHIFIRETIADQSLTPEERRTEIEYAYDLAKQNAINEIGETEIEDTVAAENAEIDAVTDPSTGMYIEAVRMVSDGMGGLQEQPGWIVGHIGGQPVFLPEGVENTEDNRVVLKPGDLKEGSEQQLPKEQAKSLNEEMIREEAAAQAELESKYAPKVLSAQMQQGVPFNTPTSQIVPVQPMLEGNGWIVEEHPLDTNNKVSKQPIVREMTNDEFRDLMQAELDRKEEQKPETEQPKQRGTVATPVALAYLLEGGQNSIENLGYFLHGVAGAFPELENEIETIRGNIGSNLGVTPDRFAEVAPREMAEMKQAIESKYGKEGAAIFDELVANATGYLPKVGAEMALRIEALKPIDVEENNAPQSQNVEQPKTSSEEIEAQEETGTVAGTENVQQQAPTLESVVASLPKTDKGEIDYNAMTPQQQFQYTSLSESPEVALEDLQADITANEEEIAKTQKQLSKARGGKRAELRDKMRQLASVNEELKAFYNSVSPQQQEVGSKAEPVESNQVVAETEKPKKANKPKLTGRKKQQSSEFTDEELRPANGVELAAEQFAAGNIKITVESYKKETGHSDEERKKLGLTPFRGADKGGLSIERAAEKLVEEDNANHNGSIFGGDTMAARDAIIELLGMSEKWGDVTGYIKNNRLAERKKREEAEYAEYEDYIMQAFHMSVADYEAAKEYDSENNPYEGIDMEGLDVIFAEEAIKYEQYLNGTSNEQGRINEAVEGRNVVLSEEWIGDIGGNQRDASQRPTEGIGSEHSYNSETPQESASGSEVGYDNQGNPIDEHGKLIVESVNSIDEITDQDFNEPTRNISISNVPQNVAEAIGASGKDILIKKNIFEKNKKNHKDLTPEDGRRILGETLFNPNLYGKNQKTTRPYNWILIHLADKHSAVIVEVNQGKDFVEIVNWHYLNDATLEQKKNQAIREGGLILTFENAAGNASDSLVSENKDSNLSGNNKENQKNVSAQGQEGLIVQREDESILDFAERAAEEHRRRPLRARAIEWSKALGVDVIFVERLEDVKSQTAYFAISEGQKVAGWYEGMTGKVYFYMPNLDDISEVDKTYIHEVVAHKGLKEMLGKERFDELCDKVWDMMPNTTKVQFIQYPGVNGNTRAAADEYIAHLAEKEEQTPEEKTMWDRIVKIFRDMFETALNAIIGRTNITNEDISNLIKASYANLKANSSNEVLSQIEKAREEVDQNPTEAQKEAGNYKKGHVKIDGYDITIENPKGGVRSGTDKNGKKWSITMNNDYGYIRGTEAVDGDHIDVFLSDNPTEGNVFVVDQTNEDGSFDESKVMYGFNSLEEAREAYLSNYEKGWESRIMAITEVSKEEFKKWIDSSHRKTKAFSEYKSVKAEDQKPYTIEPAQYTTKKGKVLDMHLVKFTGELRKGVAKNAYSYSKSLKGWWDREKGGFMMRSEDEAKQLAEYVADAQSQEPVSITDIKAVNDGDVLFTEPQQPKEVKDNAPVWQYSVSVEKKSGRTTLKRDDVSGIIPIGDARFTVSAESPEEMLDILRNPLNGMKEVLDVVGVTLENKIKTRAMDKKVNKPSIERPKEGEYYKNNMAGGDAVAKISGIGKEGYIVSFASDLEDAENKLFMGDSIVPNEEMDKWITEGILTKIDKKEQPKKQYHGGDRVFSTKHNANKDIYMAHRKGESIEYLFTDGTKANENEVQDALPEYKDEPKTNLSGNKLVTDERYAELRERMRKKLGGQMNIGIDPEILAIGTEMAVYHIEKGARKFAEYARAMIEDLGDAIRPYLKAFYNGARDLPEMQNEGLTVEMTPYEEVSSFDVANFDKASIDVLATAETIVKEQVVEEQVIVARERVKKQRKTSKKEKENVSLDIDLFNENIEDYETGTEEQRGNSSSKRDSDKDREMGSKTREEGSRTPIRGEAGSVSGYNVSDEKRSGRVHGVSGKSDVKNNTGNFSFGESHIEIPSGEIAKLKANIEAIRTLKEIEASGQPATEEQKNILSKYVGWGGLSAALDEQKYLYSKGWQADRNWNEKYLPYYIQLKELLNVEEFNDAVQSTTTSHYTPEEIIRGLWNIVNRFGFKGGRINEPAAGVGHIIGFMPKGISENSIISGTEIDSLSGRIAKVLYPDANIKVQGYEKEFSPRSKDLVITNVPFGKTAPYDKALDKALRKKMGSAYNLHNYFIAKGLLELKEGGIGVFVTSSATMDGANSKFREWVAANGVDLVGAIRLPNNAFLKNAGTSVTADILVFRKRKVGETSNGNSFVSTTQIGEGSYKENNETRIKPIMVNEYFSEHPEMMLGTMMTAHDAGSGGLYSGASQTLVSKKNTNLSDELQNAIMALPIESNEGEYQSTQENVSKVEATNLKDGSLVVNGNDVYVANNGELQPIGLSENKKVFNHNGKKQKVSDAVRDYNSLKETLKSLIKAEQSTDENPEPLRKELNNKYDSFVDKYGTLNRNKALDNIIAEDFEHNLPLSLENVRRVPSATGKSMVWEVTKGEGILSKRVSFPVEEPKTAENIDDAIHISRSYRGFIDIPYIASLIDKTELEVTTEMLQEGLAYRDPITGELIDKDTYLSGNVKEKLEQARAMAEEFPEEYQRNVDDLSEAQPETVRFGDISYRIGTPWIPSQYINDFALDVLGIRDLDVVFVPTLNEFVVSKTARLDDFAKSGQFRTERVGVIDLLGYALNQRKPKIFDKRVSYGPFGKVEEKIPNEVETQAAAEKIMEISDKFIEYIDGRKEIHRELERIYNDKYNNYRLKEYEMPSFEHYPNSNAGITLRDHQKKAVQRCLSESTLLAHQVGTGKTFTMITTAMEMRRLGIAKKPMIVVQNATLEDFVKDFYKLYPGANVLAPGKDERSAENRKRLFNLIATGDFDAIVIPQSFMQFIPDDEGRKKELIQKRIDEYEQAMSAIEDRTIQSRMQRELDSLRDSLEDVKGGKKKRTVKDIANAGAKIQAKTEKVLDRRTDDVLTFEQMGIDALFIDEAHNFKKIGFASKMSNVKGIDTSASQRANSLLLKAQYVQEKNGGRNVILATGTPITNTMAEVWTMMKFVSPEILETYNIQSFDDFATTFGVVEPSLEFTATGNFKVADRFKSYVNVPELVKAFRSHADVVLTTDVKEFKENNKIPKLKDDQMTNVVIEKNEDLEDVMDVLIKRLEAYNEMSGSEKREWSALPLVVFSRAKQAAIDLRLLNPSYEDNPNSKTNHVVKNVLRLYNESTPDKGTQLVFCDSYQSPGEAPKMDLFDFDPDVPRFNLYEDIKKKLVEGGIPESEIAIVNNYDGEKRKQLFEKVRNGDVRVLLGSTEKMGVGVNVQDRLYALHHIDAPIRPMDFEQRNGRILRQGNLYAEWGKPVNVVTYGVQGTLDATAYDRLRIKQDFINQMMKGDVSGRVMEEQDEEDPSGMTFNQMAATLSGDKTAQLLFVAENDLKKLRNSKRSDLNSKSAMAQSIQSETNRLSTLNERGEFWNKAAQTVDKYFPDGVTDIKVNGQTIREKFGVSLDPVIEEYEERYSFNRGLDPLKMNLNNGNAEVIVHFNEGKMVYELYAGKEHVVESRQFNGGKGLISSIEHQLKATRKNLEENKQKIVDSKKKIQGLEKAMNTPWGREEELKRKEQEVAELKKKLEEQALENSKKKPVEQPKNEVEVEDYLERAGEGAFNEDEVSMANDQVGKVIGKSTRTASERKTFAERERQRMIDRANSLAKKLGLNNVEIVTDASTLTGNQRNAKGFYSKRMRKITIVIPNHSSVFDVEQTLLHEAVAHYGLRELFGAHFDVFLNNVYRNASPEVRRRINELATKNGWDFPKATEEYLASLAEDTNFENMNDSWWNKIKQFFLNMLHQIGFPEFSGVTLTDNELRYILWRSYENLAEPGRYRSILGEAADVVMQDKLNVGNYAITENVSINVAEPNGYTYTPEDVIAEFEEIVANHPDMYAVRTEADIDSLPTDRLTKRALKGKMKEPRKAAVQVKEDNMMVLFVNHMDEAELRDTIPHELAHFSSRNIKLEDSYKMSAYAYLQRKFPDSFEKVQEYSRDKWGEEAVAYLFEEKVKELGFERILNGKFDTHNDIGYIFYNITNYLNNGRKRNNPLRHGERSSENMHSGGKESAEKKNVFGMGIGRLQRKTEESVYGNDRSGVDRKLGSVSSATMGVGYENEKVDDDILYRTDVEGKHKIRDEYESLTKKGRFQTREAVQDSMLSLRRMQELIEKAEGKKLRDFENAWMHENRLSSVVQSEIHEMERKFYKPMTEAVKKLMKAAKLEQEQIADYLMLKHAIERNREMAVRKALTDNEGKIDRKRLNDWYDEKRKIRQDASLDTWRKKQEAMDDAALMFGADMSRDYSGLTSMFDTDDLADCTVKAYNEVEALENTYPYETEAIGKAVKAMTQNTLDESFGSGLMNRAVYDELSNDMYDYYIPLRGFDETTSDEVYAYMDNERGAFNAPLVRAKGRSSKADNPIAYLKSISESGIMQGERNKMKQTFLNMVINHPSDLVSVSEGVWAIYNPATGEWEAASFPESNVPRNATPADVEAAYEQWESNMEQRSKQDPNVKKISESADVPYRVIGNRMNQHQVIVKRLGKSYTLTVNGNPRLAMALNGLTNPNNTSNDGKLLASIQNKIDRTNRALSAWYTTRNPDFVASNFMRDTFYTNTIVRAKEGNNYANHFHAHYAKLLIHGKMIGLFRKYENGTLDLSKPMERDFHEFMLNGGETGYSNLKDLEHIKKQIAKDVKGGRLEDIKGILDKLDMVNRAVENTARFAAYRTSRQQGRSVARSIFDAKEISVNFNKKGSGGTFYGATGQTIFGNLAAAVGAGGRSFYVFFNAAVQGTTNLLHVMKVNPAGTGAGLAAMFLMGAVLPMLLGGDDEKDYYDLPEHVRRNHLILPGTGNSWVSIPLPIEYRIMYGMGELLTSWRTGHERGENIGKKMLSLTGQALPLNFLEEGVDVFMPSALSPLWQVYNNESWTGLPIYKDNEFNKDDPEYTKAYKNVNRGLYRFTKALYEWTFDEENQKARVDLNPAVIEHVAKGYFGGLVTTLDNIWKTSEMIAGERDFDWRNVPIGNRTFKSGDERTKEKRIQNEYFDNVERFEFMQSRERLLRKTRDGKGVPGADKLEARRDYEIMQGSDVYRKYITDPNSFKTKKKAADKIYRQRKDKGDSEELERKYFKALEEANKSVR